MTIGISKGEIKTLYKAIKRFNEAETYGLNAHTYNMLGALQATLGMEIDSWRAEK